MVFRSILVLLIVIRISRASATFNNISATEASNPEKESTSSEDLPQQEWLSRLFDHQAWRIEDFTNVSHVCKEHIGLYLKELKWDSSWATKMNDASGRYNGQFFFGNDFWLGSSTLCWELGNPATNTHVPPYPVHFSVAKVQIALGHSVQMQSEQPRQLMISFCLPSSCSALDVKALLVTDAAKAVKKLENTTLEILDVRPVPGDYDVLKDVKFYILGGVAATIAVLVAIATLFELWLNSRERCETDDELQAQTNNNNELKNAEIKSKGTDKRDKLKQKKGDHKRKGLASRLLLSFSALSNGKKILEVDKLPEDSIKCVHGLRFVSVSWVILVHTYLQVFSVAENKTLRIIIERFFIYQTISNATFSVDTFFFISGLLVTILYFRTASHKPTTSTVVTLSNIRIFSDSVKKFFLLLFYRLARLTPAYLFVLGMHEVILRYLHNSSVFEPNFYDHVTCDHYWWRNALYINNLFPQKEICMLWSWYMSNDTQFYIVAVFLLLIAVRSDSHLKLSGFLLSGFLLSSWVTTFIIALQNNYHARIEDPFALFDQLYDKPWMRVGPYLVGMATGWVLHKVRGKCRMHWGVVVVGWVLSATTMISLVYGVGKDGIRVPLSAFYAALGHSAWGFALAWITFACCTGHGGPVDTLLSFRGFLPFSRLTYCAYLVHPMLMCITSFQMDGPLHLHNGVVLVIYFGNVVVSFLFSFLISLGFEAPVVRLLKIIMGGRSKDD